MRRLLRHLVAYGSTNKYRPVRKSKASGATAKRPTPVVYFFCATATMLTTTATEKAMDSQRWICRTHLFQFNGTSSEDEPKQIGHAFHLDSRLLSRRRRQVGRCNTELFRIFHVQPLPTPELHRLDAGNAADRSSAEKAIQNIETNVPARSTHCDKAAIQAVPERQARAAAKRFEFPPGIGLTPVVLKHLGSVDSRHCYFGNLRRGRCHPRELHLVSNRTQAPIGVEGRPLAQMCRFGKRPPHFFRFVAQLSHENERPHLSVLFYLRPAGRAWCVLLAIAHFALLVFLVVRVDGSSPMRSR